MDQPIYSEMETHASKWKQNNDPYEPLLNKRDLNKIRQTCAYPKFVKLLLKDNKLTDYFFEIVFNRNLSIRLFITRPFIMDVLQNDVVSFLDKPCGLINRVKITPIVKPPVKYPVKIFTNEEKNNMLARLESINNFFEFFRGKLNIMDGLPIDTKEDKQQTLVRFKVNPVILMQIKDFLDTREYYTKNPPQI